MLTTCTDLRVRAGSKKWHEVRRSGIGASEISMALGIAPESWGGPRALYHRKRGEWPDDFDNAEMEWGRELESVILKRFLKCHPEFVLPQTGRAYRSLENPWQLATPDAVVFDPRIGFIGDNTSRWISRYGYPVIVEVKTAHKTEGWGTPGTDEVPVYYRAQVLQAMDVCGADLAWMPVLFRGREYREYRIRRDDKDIEILRARGRDFWRRIEEGNPPPVDAGAATSDGLRTSRLMPDEQAQVDGELVKQIERVKRLQKRVERQRALLENRLLEAMGSAGVAMAGASKVATRTSYTQRVIDTTRLREEDPATAEKYTTTRVQRRLYVTTKELS